MRKSHAVEVEVGAKIAIVLRKRLRMTNMFSPAPNKDRPNIIRCLLSVKKVGEHHGVRLRFIFSL